jgi:hypothetical protein
LSGLGNLMLRVGGIKEAKREVPEIRAGKLEQQGHQPLEMQLWLGARMPAIAFIVIVGSFTFSYHLAPALPWLLVFFALDFAIIVCWPPKKIGMTPRNIWSWGQMMSWLLAIGFAMVIGLINYGIIESWVNMHFLREYNNVLPNSDPMAVSDGGILNFAAGTRLDIKSAAGFKFWLYNYCAAPVVGADPGAVPVTFWAVGVGCCDKRGGFDCNSGGDSSARSAMPLREYNLTPEMVDHYNHAIRMSAAANQLEVAKEKMFVIWHKDPHAVGKRCWWTATIIFLVLSLVAVCVYQGLSGAIYWKAQQI